MTRKIPSRFTLTNKSLPSLEPSTAPSLQAPFNAAQPRSKKLYTGNDAIREIEILTRDWTILRHTREDNKKETKKIRFHPRVWPSTCSRKASLLASYPILPPISREAHELGIPRPPISIDPVFPEPLLHVHPSRLVELEPPLLHNPQDLLFGRIV